MERQVWRPVTLSSNNAVGEGAEETNHQYSLRCECNPPSVTYDMRMLIKAVDLFVLAPILVLVALVYPSYRCVLILSILLPYSFITHCFSREWEASESFY